MNTPNRFAVVLLLAAASCSSSTSSSSKSKPAPAPPDAPSKDSELNQALIETPLTTEPGVPGGVAVQTRTFAATVTSVDRERRTLTLTDVAGRIRVVPCGPEVRNFDQIQIHDHIKCTVTEELLIRMAPPTGPADTETATKTVTLAPKGAKPGAVSATTVQLIATVTAIDTVSRQATLRFPDGSLHIVTVREDIDLTRHRPGEKVLIRATESVAVAVEKP